MEKRKPVPVWVSIILLILCVISVAGLVCMLTTNSHPETAIIISCIFGLCADALALLYCFMGYKKSAAKLFMVFSVVLTIFVLVQLKHYMVHSPDRTQNTPPEITAQQEGTFEAPDFTKPGENAIPASDDEAPAYENFADTMGIFIKISIPALIFAMIFTLTVAADLGRKKSYWLIGLSAVLSLINLTAAVIRASTHLRELSLSFADLNAGVGSEFAMFILCVIYGVMIYAKYQDKAARGAK